MTTVSESNYTVSAIKREITERGYWYIILQPEEYPQKLFSPDYIYETLKESQVRYRWWHYPHISDHQKFGAYHEMNNCVESHVRYVYFAEVFRFYQSGQFIHYAGMHEDRKNDESLDTFVEWDHHMSKPRPEPHFLEPVFSLFRLTEIFCFASNLARRQIFGEGINITIKLHNQHNRILKSDEPKRAGMWDGTSSKDTIVLFDGKHIERDTLRLDHDKMAVDAAVNLLSFFGYESKYLAETFENYQERLYEGIF